MNLKFTGFLNGNDDNLYINTARFYLKTGGMLTIDRKYTDYHIYGNNKLVMEWKNCYIWALNDCHIFGDNGLSLTQAQPDVYFESEIIDLLSGAEVRFTYDDEAPSDYFISKLQWEFC